MKVKKFLFIGMSVLLLNAALFFASCGSPEDGAAGSVGATGPYPVGGDVDPAELRAAFALTNDVILKDGATVYGEVPPGKRLVVAETATVKVSETLEVKGALQIEAGGSLDASFVTSASGYVTGAGQSSARGRSFCRL